MICSCSICQAEFAADDRRRSDREAYERNLDWQFAVISKDREARGARPLTRSEWLSGCFEDEEAELLPQRRRRWPWVECLICGLVLVAIAFGAR